MRGASGGVGGGGAHHRPRGRRCGAGPRRRTGAPASRLQRHRRLHRLRLVSHRRDDRGAVLDPLAVGDRHRQSRQSAGPRRRRAVEGTPPADPAAAGESAASRAYPQHGAGNRIRRDRRPPGAGVLSAAAVARRHDRPHGAARDRAAGDRGTARAGAGVDRRDPADLPQALTRDQHGGSLASSDSPPSVSRRSTSRASAKNSPPASVRR